MSKKNVGKLISQWMDEFGMANGYELSRTEFVKEKDTWYLRVYVDRLIDGEYGTMSTDDCELISRYISEKLDSEDPIEQNYYLEVSSPGMDRLLVSDKDFIRFKGEMIEVKLYEPINGSKHLIGELLGYEDGLVTLKDENGNEITLPKEKAGKINLAVIF